MMINTESLTSNTADVVDIVVVVVLAAAYVYGDVFGIVLKFHLTTIGQRKLTSCRGKQRAQQK